MWHVYWTRGARDRLHTILENEPQIRPAIAKALQKFTKSLEQQPGRVGESRSDNMRVETVDPLTIYFVPIVSTTTIIQVVGVHLVGQRPNTE